MTTSSLGYIREKSKVEKLIRKPIFWILFCSLSVLIPVLKTVNRELPPELPVLFKVPEFNFTNQYGQEFGSKDLKGRIYLANFLFTTCPTTCPALVNQLKTVQKRVRGLGQKVAIVSFSVDPKNDTPEVLKKYAKKTKANPFVWTWLTGDRAELKELLVHGYKVPMGDGMTIDKKVDRSDVSIWDIAHSNKIVLVDVAGQIRGYYGTDYEGVNKLMIDLGLLANRTFNP
ncbi:MAG: photosynthetic protein synthase I [Halobacteriovorax sp.]|nr:photosynthetic protein synthase I [Halobacteriovorax sp.]|tara:strand:+ start:566055 stop:566741 length:687 start_codon:yes stop_codon:yes gene_type:complete